MDYYSENGKFPGKLYSFRRRVTPLINWISWLVLSITAFSYGLWRVLAASNWYLIITASCILIFGNLYFVKMHLFFHFFCSNDNRRLENKHREL